MRCMLALEDGTVLSGRSVGASGTATGEVVFNTAMAGYQEVLSDPSYYGQIVAMTAPMIGNYGVNSSDEESPRPVLSAFVIRELASRSSSWRAEEELEAYLTRHRVVAVEGVDTRALTLRLRTAGSL
ncbi:MAG: carbamoyl phosphate synthase small subunit, partial [bacterium]|nr:carbamoyl phosphate synthase small subunit [bacterium]